MRKGTPRFSLWRVAHIMKSARSPNLRIVPAAIILLESNEITAAIAEIVGGG
jgi:hypothetical protein